MKYTFLMILSLTFLFSGLFAQQKSYRGSEVGLFIGCSYYLGDLNRNGHFNSLTRPAGGLVYRYNFNPRFSVKGNLFMGTLMGDDARSGVPAQEFRNLHFKSPVTEFGANLEFNFLNYVIGHPKTPFTPYVFGGVGVFFMSPKAQLGNNWYALQPLGTEGQGTSLSDEKRYSLTQVCLPFGIGVKAWIASRVGLSLEWGFRKTFTDYIDDVSTRYVDPVILASSNGSAAAYFSDTSLSPDHSQNVGKQRGDPSTKDWYSFAGLILTFKLKNRAPKCVSYN